MPSEKSLTVLASRYISFPRALTDKFQPLDRVVFGVLKSHTKHLFRERFRVNLYQRRTKMNEVADMLTVWGLLGVSVIDSAWDVLLE
jgi:hypothetical protein